MSRIDQTDTDANRGVVGVGVVRMSGPPTEPGLYWASPWTGKPWTLIVKVAGTAPFLTVESVWQPTVETNHNPLFPDGKASFYSIAEWGPRIPQHDGPDYREAV